MLKTAHGTACGRKCGVRAVTAHARARDRRGPCVRTLGCTGPPRSAVLSSGTSDKLYCPSLSMYEFGVLHYCNSFLWRYCMHTMHARNNRASGPVGRDPPRGAGSWLERSVGGGRPTLP